MDNISGLKGKEGEVENVTSSLARYKAHGPKVFQWLYFKILRTHKDRQVMEDTGSCNEKPPMLLTSQ